MVRFFGTEGTWTSLKTARDFGDIFHAKHHTLQGTNISHQKSLLKMIFLFPRWDMLIPWRVVLLCSVSTNFKAKGPFDLDWCWLPISPRPSIYDPCSTLIFLDSDHFQWNSRWLNKIWSIYIYRSNSIPWKFCPILTLDQSFTVDMFDTCWLYRHFYPYNMRDWMWGYWKPLCTRSSITLCNYFLPDLGFIGITQSQDGSSIEWIGGCTTRL